MASNSSTTADPVPPDAQAALELFSAQGFEQTTAIEIAAAAGLTERTFF